MIGCKSAAAVSVARLGVDVGEVAARGSGRRNGSAGAALGSTLAAVGVPAVAVAVLDAIDRLA